MKSLALTDVRSATTVVFSGCGRACATAIGTPSAKPSATQVGSGRECMAHPPGGRVPGKQEEYGADGWRMPAAGYFSFKSFAAFSLRTSGRTSSRMSSFSKSDSQRSGVIAGQSEPNSILCLRMVLVYWTRIGGKYFG